MNYSEKVHADPSKKETIEMKTGYRLLALVLATQICIGCFSQAHLREEQLVLAAAEGRTQEVKDLLKQGVSVDAKFEDGSTALSFATTNGHYDTAKVLLDAGASLDAKDHRGRGVDSRVSNPRIKQLLEEYRQKASEAKAQPGGKTK